MSRTNRSGPILVMAAAMTIAPPADAQGKAAGPQGNVGQYFGADAYPPEAIRQGQEGRTVAVLWVDQTGKVVSCTVGSSSGSESLDQATCRIALAQVHYTPAIDESGKPTASSVKLPVRWVLPHEPTEMAAKPLDSTVELTVSTDAKAEVIACAAKVEPPVPLPTQPCDPYPIGKVAGRLLMTRDGKPVGATVTQTMHQHIVLDP